MTGCPPAEDLGRAAVIAVVLATTAAQVASVMGSTVFPVIAPELAPALGVAPSLVGYQVSLIYGVAMACSPFMGNLVPRLGACRVTQIGLVLSALAMLLAMTPSLPALAAASVVQGMGMSVMQPASSHLLFRFSPARHRNLIFSLKQTGIPLAWVLGAAIAPAAALALGWRWALAIVLAGALAVAAAMQRWRAAWDADRGRTGTGGQGLWAGLRVVWRHPALRWLSAMSLCLTFVQLCLASFAVILLVEEAAYSLVAAGFLLSFTHAVGAAGRVFWGWVADAIGDALRVLGALIVLMGASCALAMLVSPAWPGWLLTLLFALCGASVVAWNGVFMAETARRAPHGQVSTAVGGAMVWSYGGVLAGPALFATAYTMIGSYTLTFGVLVVVSAAGFALLRMAARAARSVPPAAGATA